MGKAVVQDDGQGSWREAHLVHVDLEVGGSCFFAELPTGKVFLRLPLNLAHSIRCSPEQSFLFYGCCYQGQSS